MTDRQKRMIEGYLPNKRDPELPEMEYYVEDSRGRAVRVHIWNIAYDRSDRAIYQVTTDSGQLIHGPHECDTDTFGGGWYHKSALYDNKTDCKNWEHVMYDDWEQLRKIQEEAS